MGSQGPVGPLDPWALWTWPLDPVPFGPTWSLPFRQFFPSPGWSKSRPSWGFNPSTPWTPGGFGTTIRSTKIAPKASQAHRAAPRSPQQDQHFHLFFLSPGCSKSRPSWGLNPSTPWPSGWFSPNICLKVKVRFKKGPKWSKIRQTRSKNDRKNDKTNVTKLKKMVKGGAIAPCAGPNFWILFIFWGGGWAPNGPPWALIFYFFLCK